MHKQRLSVSVEHELVAAGEQAVTRGRARSLSAWVNDALRLKADHDRRLEALASFVAAYELEHGEITTAEMQQAVRKARSRAVSTRAVAGPARSKPRRAARR
jgi:Arc/MetJ-type ribon-helix-helix transcriptional regulator